MLFLWENAQTAKQSQEDSLCTYMKLQELKLQIYFQERLKLSPLLGAVVLHCRWKCIRCNKELQPKRNSPNVSSFCAQVSNFKENRNEELVFPKVSPYCTNWYRFGAEAGNKRNETSSRSWRVAVDGVGWCNSRFSVYLQQTGHLVHFNLDSNYNTILWIVLYRTRIK